MACAPSEDSDQPGHPSLWSESSLSAWRKFGSLATLWAHSEDSDQTGRMPRLIWVFAGRTVILFAGRTVILLVLSWGGSYDKENNKMMARECHNQRSQPRGRGGKRKVVKRETTKRRHTSRRRLAKRLAPSCAVFKPFRVRRKTSCVHCNPTDPL